MIIYRAASLLVTPFIPLFLQLRMQQGKEDPLRWRERLGYGSQPRPNGTVVWVHAASVGESNSVLELIRRITSRYSHLQVLLTSGTVSSARLLQNKLPPRTLHQFVPVDTLGAVRRFLSHWKPNIALLVESELWPNLITQTHATGCSMALINARMSDKSYQSWQRLPSFIGTLLRCFTQIFAQSEQDAKRLSTLGGWNVQCVGNLKYDAAPLIENPAIQDELREAIGERALWLAASTHPGEEEIIARVHRSLKTDSPNLLTIIVPRHAVRGPAIQQALLQAGYRTALRSRGEQIAGDTDIYVADTMGELGIFYRLVQVVLMGGSLVPHGGQNPLEPAQLHCAIITGPHMYNFEAICAELQEAGGLLRVTGPQALANTVANLLKDRQRSESQGAAAHTVTQSKRGVADALLQALSPWLDKSAQSRLS